MRMPKYFCKWFNRTVSKKFSLWERDGVKKVAYRAYRKGVADTKNKYFNPWEKE